jgi:acyl-CoA thioesterase
MDIQGEDFQKAMGHDAFAELSGLEVIRAEPGYAEVRMPVTPQVLNGHGLAHGGALFTLADYATAIACNLLGRPSVGAYANISYLRPVREGFALAKARTVKDGRRLQVSQVEIFDLKGGLCALFQCATMAATEDRGTPRP